MRTSALLLTLAMVAVVFSGCGAKPGPSPTSTSPLDGHVGGVVLTRPGPAAAGEKSLVCWSVQGNGTVAHVAIHWDSQSHATKTPRDFRDYTGGTSYPGNATTPAAGGYALPGRFCAAIEVPAAGTLYVVAHAMDMYKFPGFLTPESQIRAVGGGTVSVLTAPNGPATGGANSQVNLCWSVSGTGNIAHMALHWSNVSQESKAGRAFTDYRTGVIYPSNRTTADPYGYNLAATGARYCANVQMPAAGSLYVVSHTMDRAGAPGRISDEKVLTVA